MILTANCCDKEGCCMIDSLQPDGCRLSVYLIFHVCHVICQYCQVCCPEG